MTTLTVYSPSPDSNDDCYVVVTDDPATIGLFGTNALPAPFTSVTPLGAVELRLRELNPGVDVRCWGRWNPDIEAIPLEGGCLVCGCTQSRECASGCSWVGPALCSSCAPATSLQLDARAAPALGEIEDFPW